MGYFLLLGIAYFILEISLMKMYQSHTGSPTGSLLFVLGALLLGSGSGAWLARNRGRRVMLPAMAAIIVLSLYQVFFGLRLLTALAPTHWLELLIIGGTVFPLGLATGVPFPAGLEMMKAHAGDLPVPLYFLINCIASSFTVVFGLYLCVVLGFTITAVAGIGFYVLSLGLLLFIIRPA